METRLTKIIPLFCIMLLLSFQSLAQLENALRLTLSSGSYSDETVVRFLEEATDSFDPDWDAYKLKNQGNTPNLFTVVDQRSYVINAFHYPFAEKTVDLNLEVAFSGTYTITAEEIGPFSSTCSIILVDKVLNISQDLKNVPQYTFSFFYGAPSDRFLIKFKETSHPSLSGSVTSVKAKSLEDCAKVYTAENRIIVELSHANSEVSVGIYDLSGRKIAVTEYRSGLNREFIPQASGTLIMQLVEGNQVYSKKIYIYQ